jgi:hypothetical protein
MSYDSGGTVTYILVIWTVVAMAGDRHYQAKAMDWRPLGEFYTSVDVGKNGREMCEDAARQLGLKSENYRCVRSK